MESARSRRFRVPPLASLLASLLLALVGTTAAQALPREVRTQILEAVVEVRPYDPTQESTVDWSGSGTIISPDGFVLTNYHVVGDLETREVYEWHAIFVTDPRAPDRPPQHAYWARFVAGDPTHDLALVRIEEYDDETPVPAGETFPAVAVGDSNALIPGDPLTVVGYPGISGATITFTTGIVGGFLGEDREAGGRQWIKTDAKIARGNSGGAAFDADGALVGIPTLLRQRDDEGVFEEQFYLRPVALAWALIGPNVANVRRAPGTGATAASAAPNEGSDDAAVTPPVNPLAQLPDSPPQPANPLGRPASPPEGGAPLLAQRGELAAGDAQLESGEYYDVYEVRLDAGTPLAVALESSAFDPYLALLDPEGSVVLEVDDSEGRGLNVFEAFIPSAAGAYRVVVSSAFPGEVGDYEIRVEGGAASGAGAAPPVPGSAPDLAATVVAARSGTIGELALPGGRAGRLAREDGASYHSYWIDVPPGTPTLTVTLEAEADLDLFLKHGTEILDWTDEQDWDRRDITPASGAEFVIAAPAAGRWFVDVVLYVDPGIDPGYTLRAR